MTGCEFHPCLRTIGSTQLLNDQDELERVQLCERCFRRLSENEEKADRVVRSHLENKADEDAEKRFRFYVVQLSGDSRLDVIPIQELSKINPMIRDGETEILDVKEYEEVKDSLYEAKTFIWENFEAGDYI